MESLPLPPRGQSSLVPPLTGVSNALESSDQTLGQAIPYFSLMAYISPIIARRCLASSGVPKSRHELQDDLFMDAYSVKIEGGYIRAGHGTVYAA